MSNLKNFLFTSESVSEGHPDKVSDRISDMVVDSYLARDPFSRVACETLTTTNKVVLAGEVRGPAIKEDELIQKVRDCIKDIGYDQDGFTWREATKIESYLHSQSTDIAMGVDSKDNKDEGAGDQGIMFGYACNETEELMPAPIHYSHKILRLMAEDRKSGKLKNIEPDSKSQVTFEYIDGKPNKVKSVVISSQHSADVDQSKVRELLTPYMLKAIPEKFLKGFDEKEFYVNPTGNFVIGGPDGDCGLTGRKIIVDTYGGAAPHGGGAFSGKDPTKVDRSAAYAARYIAKNVVASNVADKCLIQLAYAIGVSKPLSIYVDLFDDDSEKNKFISEKISANFDLSPRGIREMLSLNKPIYEKTAAYGHFGRAPEDDGSFSWEKTYEILNEELASSLIFVNKFEFWDYCINEVINNKDLNVENKLVIEFGVGSGNSINYIANQLNKKKLKIYGFDTFFGNPEIWPGTDNTVGSSDQYGKIPKNLKFNVEIIKGKIEDTLDSFFEKNDKEIALIHIDVNIFSTSKFILEKIKNKMVPGTVIIFDELVNYPFWWKNGEYKAPREVFDDKNYNFIAFDNAKKAAIKIK